MRVLRQDERFHYSSFRFPSHPSMRFHTLQMSSISTSPNVFADNVTHSQKCTHQQTLQCSNVHSSVHYGGKKLILLHQNGSTEIWASRVSSFSQQIRQNVNMRVVWDQQWRRAMIRPVWGWVEALQSYGSLDSWCYSLMFFQQHGAVQKHWSTP